MEFEKSVRNKLSTTEQVQILDQPDPLDFSKLQRAVVVVHATWSGPSVKVLREYSAAYHRLLGSFGGPVEFYVLNPDRLTDTFFCKLPGRFGGNGETFLVRDGVIIRSIPFYIETFEAELRTAFVQSSNP